MIEWKQSPLPNQLKPNRSDSWATVFQGDLNSKYTLYHLAHGKAKPGWQKILFHEYAAKLINPENPPLPHKIRTLAHGLQSLEAHGGQLLAPLETPVNASA